jgi:hypothetical protein
MDDTECINCGTEFDGETPLHRTDDNGDSFCRSCSDELFGEDDGDEILDDDIFRQPNRRTDPNMIREIDDTKDIPEKFEALPLLKSTRSFGVELEMFGGNNEKLQEYSAQKNHRYDRDGSIVGSHACEIASKVFQGKTGGQELLDLTQVSIKNGFKTNFSCGTHVHLGAKDFFSTETFKESNFAKLPSRNENIIMLVELPLLVQMRKSLNENTIITDFVQEASLNYKRGAGWFTNYTMYDGRTSNVCVVPCVYMGVEYLILMRVSTLERLKCKPNEVLHGNARLELGDKFTELRKADNYHSVATLAIDRVVPFYKPSNKVWEKLKSLFAVYSYFDELLFCMLPPRRRNSAYCKPLRETYALSDVLDCNSQENIERTWYKENSAKGVAYAKTQHGTIDSKYNSRYHSVNIHSLFYRHGTLEIRMHHGTTNGNSILAWVVLHQRIMDMVADGKLTWDLISNLDRRASRQKKAYMFKKLLLLDKEPELLRFVSHRLKLYSNIILK